MQLKIRKMVITHVRVPLIEPFCISSGAVSEKDGIIVELHASELVGYGESSPMAGSFYSCDTPEASWTELCEVVAPAIVGHEFEGPADWNQTLDGLLAGNFTKAGVETAFWDLKGKRENKPLHVLLGGTRRQIQSGLAVGLYDKLSAMLRTVEKYLVCGYHRVKLKIEPGRDVEVVKAARKEFGDIPLFVDANGAYTPRDLDIFRELDEFGLMMFEQPFPGSFLEELAELQRCVRTPICLDESLHSSDQLRLAIELGSLQIANVKVQRVGGFYHALEMDRICREHGITAWVGTMPELGIGQAQGAALASLSNFVYPTDVEASDRWFKDDITSPFIRVQNGNIELPECPGLGYKLDFERIRNYQVASRSFAA
jgi:o-succinylbenzoate synthase